MTCHACGDTATPVHWRQPPWTIERLAWFVMYLHHNPDWGVFGKSLLGNYRFRAAPHGCPAIAHALTRAAWPADVREAADWFDRLHCKHRRRLRREAEEIQQRVGRGAIGASPWPPHSGWTVYPAPPGPLWECNTFRERPP